MKILNIITIVIFSIFLQSCASTGSGNINKQDDCKVPGLDWMEGVEGYDKKEVYELAAKFEAAARADADKVRLLKDTNTEGSLIGSLQQIINNTTGKKVKVSQEFFQKAIAYRTAICSIERWLKEGILSAPDVRKNAEQLLLDLSVDFNSIATEISELKDEIKNIRESARSDFFKNPNELIHNNTVNALKLWKEKYPNLLVKIKVLNGSTAHTGKVLDISCRFLTYCKIKNECIRHSLWSPRSATPISIYTSNEFKNAADLLLEALGNYVSGESNYVEKSENRFIEIRLNGNPKFYSNGNVILE